MRPSFIVRRLALIAIALLLGTVRAQAQNINLAWDQHQDPTVVGYTVHVGINPGVYGLTFDVPGLANTTFTFAQPVPGTRYYFAVSAYTSTNVVSALSNTVSSKINVGPTLTPPGNQTSWIGSATALQINAVDDGDPLTFTASNLPSGLSINSSTGRITGTPTTAQSRTVTVDVTDGEFSDSVTFTWTVTTALAATGINANMTAPQPPGTSVTFTASAVGGVAPLEFKWWLFDGASWTLLRNWSTANAYTWTPTQANAGYRIGIWVRSAGVTADVSSVNLSVPFAISSPSLPSITSLVSNVASPQAPGASISFTTAATGGVAPYQFKWWLFDGAAWTLLQDWSPSTSYVWTPTQANANYRISVWARNAGVTADVSSVSRTVSYAIGAPASSSAPLTITGLTSNVASPRTIGTTVTFTASAAGGVGPYEYKWWLYDGARWSLLRDWTASTFYMWTPTQANANYRIGIWARSAGVAADVSNVNYSVPFAITSSAAPAAPAVPPVAVTSITSNLTSPQLAGMSITFSATAAGGTAPYQFKWWVYNGSTWTMVRDWGASTFTWTPMTANTRYQVGVWVRNATTTVDVSDASLAVPYVISAPGPVLTAPVVKVPLNISGILSNMSSPQRTWASITFTAVSSGGTAPYQYKWWVYDGYTWTMAQDWGSATFTWRPSNPNAKYRIGIWARDATMSGDVSSYNYSIPFAIIP